MNDSRPPRALVLGLGNPFMGDDGVGIAALELLRARWTLPPSVEAVDGGTWGMNLLHLVEATDQVLLLDAIAAGGTPGTLVILEREQLPRYFHQKLSPHQIDLREVLAVAELRGNLPERIAAVGLEPAEVRWGDGLSPAIAGQLDRLVEAAVSRLRQWGHRLQPGPASSPHSLPQPG